MTIAIVGNGILLNSWSDEESQGEDIMDEGLCGNNEAHLDGKESSDTKKHSNANKCSDDREHSDSQEGPDGDEHAGDKDPTDDDDRIGTKNVDESDHGPQMDSVDCNGNAVPLGRGGRVVYASSSSMSHMIIQQLLISFSRF